jgi:hypothetical protein
MGFTPNLTNLLPDDGEIISRRTEAADRPRGVLSLATCTSQLLSQKNTCTALPTAATGPPVRPQLRASLHDLTPDQKIIRNGFTLGADNYAHNRPNYAVNNKSLPTLTARYYRYTPLYSRVRLQQNPHHHPPLSDTHAHTHDPTNTSSTVRGRQRTTDCSAACGIRVGELRPRDRAAPAREATVWPVRQMGQRNCISAPCRVLRMLQTSTSLPAGLPACVSSPGRNSMCATGGERLHDPFFRSGRIAACPN